VTWFTRCTTNDFLTPGKRGHRYTIVDEGLLYSFSYLRAS
jgi:hypothetical protein